MMYDLTEHLVELLENEKWKEIPEFPRFDHNESIDRIIEAVKEVEKDSKKMKDKLGMSELYIESMILKEKQLKWLDQFKDDENNGY
jgi:hypothetical protein